MKALTISQPYADFIASRDKWVENRTWTTSYRGPLAIHAGKGTQYLDRRELAEYPTGCIVAVSQLAAVVGLDAMRNGLSLCYYELNRCGLTCDQVLAHEHTEGPVCFVLLGTIALHRPVPCRGAQGLWTVPDEAAQQVVEQLGDHASLFGLGAAR